MVKSKNWIVTTTQDRPIQDVAKQIAKEGFAISKVLKEVGCITGSADNKVVQRLRKMKGIADISPETQIKLGPPDADETW